MMDSTADATEYIGTASMDADRNVILVLRATDGSGTVGLGRLVYSPSHENYEMVLKHIGGLKPGEEKPVKPFPERR